MNNQPIIYAKHHSIGVLGNFTIYKDKYGQPFTSRLDIPQTQNVQIRTEYDTKLLEKFNPWFPQSNIIINK